jgi:MinD-like ATPase involved in chromosome partitioning or flagellar assembly
MEKIFFISFKGGVGRTSTLINVGTTLSRRFGKRVLLVDLDYDAPGVSLYLGLDEDGRRDLEDITKTGGEIDIVKADDRDGDLSKLFVLPKLLKGSKEMFADAYERSGISEQVQVSDQIDIFRKTIEAKAREYGIDFILIDMPAGFTTRNVILPSVLKADAVVFVTHLNKQGIQGTSRLISGFAEQNKEFRSRSGQDAPGPWLIPVLTKLTHSNSLYGLMGDFNKELEEIRVFGSDIRSEPVRLPFVLQAVVGEFVVSKAQHPSDAELEDITAEYDFRSDLDVDRSLIFDRRLQDDGSLAYQQQIQILCEELLDHTAKPSHSAKGTKPFPSSDPRRNSVSILLENMEYYDSLRSEIEKKTDSFCDCQIVGESSGEILRHLDNQSKDWFAKFDLIALPNFSFGAACQSGILRPLSDVTSRGSTNGEKRIRALGSRDDRLGELVMNGHLYGVPLTRITACIAYDNSKLPYNAGLNDVLSLQGTRWGTVRNVDACTYYYEFYNILGAHGVEMFQRPSLASAAEPNFDSARFVAALELYRELLLSKAGQSFSTWTEIADALKDRKIDACFVWTEQIPVLAKTERISFAPILPIFDTAFQQSEGWFLGLSASADLGEKRDTLSRVLSVIACKDFHRVVSKLTYSSAKIDVDEDLIRQLMHDSDRKDEKAEIKRERAERLKVQRMLRRVKEKPQFDKCHRFMIDFSRQCEELLLDEHGVEHFQDWLWKWVRANSVADQAQ